MKEVIGSQNIEPGNKKIPTQDEIQKLFFESSSRHENHGGVGDEDLNDGDYDSVAKSNNNVCDPNPYGDDE